jgi:hypothetical protein
VGEVPNPYEAYRYEFFAMTTYYGVPQCPQREVTKYIRDPLREVIKNHLKGVLIGMEHPYPRRSKPGEWHCVDNVFVRHDAVRPPIPRSPESITGRTFGDGTH